MFFEMPNPTGCRVPGSPAGGSGPAQSRQSAQCGQRQRIWLYSTSTSLSASICLFPLFLLLPPVFCRPPPTHHPAAAYLFIRRPLLAVPHFPLCTPAVSPLPSSYSTFFSVSSLPTARIILSFLFSEHPNFKRWSPRQAGVNVAAIIFFIYHFYYFFALSYRVVGWVNKFAIMWVITKIRVKCCSLSRQLLSNLLVLHLELKRVSALNLILSKREWESQEFILLYLH